MFFHSLYQYFSQLIPPFPLSVFQATDKKFGNNVSFDMKNARCLPSIIEGLPKTIGHDLMHNQRSMHD